MLFVIQFRDAPEKLHIRQEEMANHLDHLKKHEDAVRVAGSLRREEDDSTAGGIWIVEAPGFDEVRRMVTEDPFFTAGLRQSVEIYRLAKAFPETAKTV